MFYIILLVIIWIIFRYFFFFCKISGSLLGYEVLKWEINEKVLKMNFLGDIFEVVGG